MFHHVERCMIFSDLFHGDAKMYHLINEVTTILSHFKGICSPLYLVSILNMAF